MKIASIVTFFIILISPVIIESFKLIDNKKLHGKENQNKELSLDSRSCFFDHNIQDLIEKHLKKKTAIGKFLIRFDNQINYWFFNQVSSDYQSNVVLGKHGNFIERTYLNDFNRVDTVNVSLITKKIKILERFQDLLNQRSIQFLLLVSTNKPNIETSIVPEKLIAPGRKERKSNMSILKPILDKYKINYIDTEKFFKNLRDTQRHITFDRTATHWNQKSACLISKEILNQFNLHENVDCKDISTKKLIKEEPALLRLSNLLLPPTVTRQPYKTLLTSTGAEDEKAKLFFIGSSFGWSLINQFKASKLFENINFYYYFSRRFSYPGKKSVKFNKNEFKLERDLLNHNMVIIEINSAALENLGFGFLEYIEIS